MRTMKITDTEMYDADPRITPRRREQVWLERRQHRAGKTRDAYERHGRGALNTRWVEYSGVVVRALNHDTGREIGKTCVLLGNGNEYLYASIPSPK